jgi:hypothetical protein
MRKESIFEGTFLTIFISSVLVLLVLMVYYSRKKSIKVKAYHFEKYDLIIGKDATEIFNYYNVTEMHGLSLDGAISRIVEGGTYIDGLSNYHPMDKELDMKLKPFLFLNIGAINNDYTSDEIHTLIMHETMHMSVKQHHYQWDTQEEEIITWAEEQANMIFKLLKKDRYI